MEESDAVISYMAPGLKVRLLLIPLHTGKTAKLIFITWGDSEVAANLCQCAWGKMKLLPILLGTWCENIIEVVDFMVPGKKVGLEFITWRLA